MDCTEIAAPHATSPSVADAPHGFAIDILFRKEASPTPSMEQGTSVAWPN
jgi:hypothetical protein